MDGAGSTEILPAVTVPQNSGQASASPLRAVVNQSVSLPPSPDSMRAPSVSNRLTNVTYKKGGGNRLRGYGQRTMAYGTNANDVVKQMYTGTLPTAFFNDICYGRRATPQEFRYDTPVREREKPLWESKQNTFLLRRVEARHVIRDIQDARFRKQDQLEKQSMKKALSQRWKTEHALVLHSETIFRKQDQLEKQSMKKALSQRRKTEHALVLHSETMTRGLQAYLDKYCSRDSDNDSPTPQRRKRGASII